MDLTEFTKDSSRSIVLKSDVPPSTKTEKCVLGIDEAGRGPVLGPMVCAATYCPVSKVNYLKAQGVADSKTLSEKKRKNLFSVIDGAKDMVGWILEIHSPTVISNSMYRRLKYNLNSLSHDSAIKLIASALDLGVNVTEVYVDTVGPPEKYEAKLSSIFPDIKFVVAKQGDVDFPIVSAASICAKVARDDALKEWKFVEGEEFQNMKYGSGYPNDPVTKKFLADNIDPVFGFPQLVRFSWSTSEKILKSNAVEVLWEDTGDKKRKSVRSQDLKNFMKVVKKFKPKSDYIEPVDEVKPKSHSFFTSRNLHQTAIF